MEPFVYDALPSRVVFGAGSSRSRLASEVNRSAARRLLLIASPRDTALSDALCAPFADLVVARFTEVRQHVPIEVAAQARELARTTQADAILALGGGSAIGMAKAVALETALPILAIPTTYAGSEMTPIYGLTSAGRKQTGRSLVVLPKVVVYDPELTLGLPAAVSGPSALNALAHCVEAFYGVGANPISSLVAEEGMRALARGVPLAVAEPSNLAGRSDTLYGAYLAGAALAVAGTGLHHRICHILGGAYNLPHAELHAVILPHAVAYNQPAIPHLMARMAAALGAPADAAAQAIHTLAISLGAPTSLAAIGLRPEQFDEALALLLDQLPPDNPRPIEPAGLRALLKAAFAGTVAV